MLHSSLYSEGTLRATHNAVLNKNEVTRISIMRQNIGHNTNTVSWHGRQPAAAAVMCEALCPMLKAADLESGKRFDNRYITGTQGARGGAQI